MKIAFKQVATRSAIAALVSSVSVPASSADLSEVEEVVVTARRRDEQSISVPVSVTALTAAQLEQHAIRTFDDIAMLSPGLTVSQVSGGVGGTIVLRGVGTAAGTNPSFEQTVSINVDGVQMSRGNALRLGQIDMQGIEVLRGPQALFFGKNSPAGVISVKTADPTDEFEAIVRGGYEPNAEQTTAAVTLSGPLTSTLRARVTASMDDINGWMDNDASKALAANAIRPGSVAASQDHGPESKFRFARGTLLFDPSDDLSIRAKYSYSKDTGVGFQYGGFQRIFCPGGVAATAAQATALNGGVPNPALAAALAVDDCKADDHFAHGNISSTALAGALPHVTKATGDHSYEQSLASLEANYSITPNLRLTSVTGLVGLSDRHYDTFSFGPADAVPSLDFSLRTGYDAVTQEVRIATDFADSPINAMFGAFYEDSSLESYVWRFTGPDAARPQVDQIIDGKSLSAFAQAFWNFNEHFELSGGARWSQEKKDYRVEVNGVGQALGVSDATFDNVSPEVTLTYRPTDRMTAYATYKTGFKSGGFSAPYTSGSAASPALIAANITGANNLYEPEEAKGGEVGFKIAALDGMLRINSAAYYYEYTDLQVNSLDNSSGVPTIRVTNAAAATVQGVEADFTFKPGIDGLELHGGANYNDAKYDTFLAACYIGQTIAEGCNLGLNPTTGRYTGQSLADKPLINAPRWTGTLGASLVRDLTTEGLAFGISTDLSYKSSYMPHPDRTPGAEQDEVTFVNASLRLFNESRGWELALVGRNLTEEFRATTSSNAPATGNGALTGTNTPGGLADLTGYVNRGRELLLQFTAYPSRWMK